MSKDVERLIKIQNVINKSVYHLFVETDLEESYKWVLFLNNPNLENYFSNYNPAIMNSNIDSLDDLENYLKKHGGFKDKPFF